MVQHHQRLGFIAPETGGKNVLAHISALERSGLTGLADGQKVTYDAESDRNGRESAVNLGPHGVMATFLMRQYFVALPKELEEAGRMDGLSPIGIWCRIALPMSRPALAAVAIITFLFSWNLFLEPLVFISTLGNFTLPLALSNFTDPYGAPLWHLQLAAPAWRWCRS